MDKVESLLQKWRRRWARGQLDIDDAKDRWVKEEVLYGSPRATK